jgi:signal transduction histidine kinase
MAAGEQVTRAGARGGARAGALVRAVVREPLRGRSLAELLYCVVSAVFGIAVPWCVLGVAVLLGLLAPGYGKPDNVSVFGLAAGVALVLLVAPPAARRLGAACRFLVHRLLGERVAPPPAARRGRGLAGRPAATLRDAAGWRATAYLMLLKPLVALLQLYAVAFWVIGVINMSYPFWWGLFRNHAPGVRLRPVPVLTPFGEFQVHALPGTFRVFVIGAALVACAPWLTRAAASLDRRLIRVLLGPAGMAARVRDLERTRARAVDDTAALLRQVERDLHDGAQVRLAALALNLGMAREKLGDGDGDGDGDGADAGDAPDIAALRELVDAAHRGAKDALAELRDLAKGLHPPALDNGLSDALATLAASSAIPVELTADIPYRPTPAIETIAYFCAAELLANAAKHSHATTIEVQATAGEAAARDAALVLVVADDGVGGADPAAGSGLAGLARRASTVDGRIDIASPPGGPTRVTVVLPLRA